MNQNPQPLSRKKTNIIIAVAVAAAAIPLAFIAVILYLIVMFFYSSNEKMSRLNEVADQKAIVLSSLVSGVQSVTAEGNVNGDGLTAQNDPEKSTYATVDFATNGTLAQVDGSIAESAKKNGFTLDGTEMMPYYNTGSSPGSSVASVTLRYVKDNQAMRVQYTFDKGYQCPIDKFCDYTAETKDPATVYDVRSYASIPVTEVRAFYGNKDMYLITLK